MDRQKYFNFQLFVQVSFQAKILNIGCFIIINCKDLQLGLLIRQNWHISGFGDTVVVI